MNKDKIDGMQKQKIAKLESQVTELKAQVNSDQEYIRELNQLNEGMQTAGENFLHSCQNTTDCYNMLLDLDKLKENLK